MPGAYLCNSYRGKLMNQLDSSVIKTEMDRLLQFLPLFDVAGRTFVLEDATGTPNYQDLHVLPEDTYEDYIQAFFSAIKRPFWQVNLADPESVGQLVYCDCEIALTDLDDIRRMLTWCAKDRDDTQAFRRMLMDDGRLISILLHLRRIRQQSFPD